jgi:hypothetical protein
MANTRNSFASQLPRSALDLRNVDRRRLVKRPAETRAVPQGRKPARSKSVGGGWGMGSKSKTAHCPLLDEKRAS